MGNLHLWRGKRGEIGNRQEKGKSARGNSEAREGKTGNSEATRRQMVAPADFWAPAVWRCEKLMKAWGLSTPLTTALLIYTAQSLTAKTNTRKKTNTKKKQIRGKRQKKDKDKYNNGKGLCSANLTSA